MAEVVHYHQSKSYMAEFYQAFQLSEYCNKNNLSNSLLGKDKGYFTKNENIKWPQSQNYLAGSANFQCAEIEVLSTSDPKTKTKPKRKGAIILMATKTILTLTV